MSTISNIILASLYYFVPAYFANGAPVLLKRFNPLKNPVDFNKKFRGYPIFGSHKTWGGLIIASLVGLLTFYIQKLLFVYPFFQRYSLFNYSEQTVWLGFLLGFGAIFGDLIKSFFKRRFHHKPGASWIPFDQLDFVLGALIFSFIIYIPPASVILVLVILTPFIHILFNHLGYYLKLKRSKW